MTREENYFNTSEFARAAWTALVCLWLFPAVEAGAQGAAEEPTTHEAGSAPAKMDEALAKDWLARGKKNITGDARNRYCDKERGEERASSRPDGEPVKGPL